MTELFACITCNGTGSVLAVMPRISMQPTTEEVVARGCIDCDGNGKITQDRLDILIDYPRIWCVCGNPSGGVNTVKDDTPGAAVMKHHWTCQDCGQVTQMG